MTLRTLRVPFIMETICFVICGIIVVAASMKEKPTTLLRTLATAGQIQEHQLEDRAIGKRPIGFSAISATGKGGCFDDDWPWYANYDDGGGRLSGTNSKSCDDYTDPMGRKSGCGNRDNRDGFTANSMCCICGGGKTDSCAFRDKKSACYKIDNRFDCLTTADSRKWDMKIYGSYVQIFGSYCNWCPDGCPESGNKCEPIAWLEAKYGSKRMARYLRDSSIERCYPFEWTQRSLVADEGDRIVGTDGKILEVIHNPDMNNGIIKVTLEMCKIWCMETAACHSVTWLPPGTCHLKNKCLTKTEAKNEDPDFSKYQSYFMPCWIERTLVKVEGNTISGESRKIPLKTCERRCDQESNCKSFAHGTQGCWLKDKCLTSDEEKKEVGDFKSYYKEDNC